ncbi:MAG: polysaccharide pyruvyl transferase family protein [Prosthecobacter sp.]|nr:polysaccharide pyruvyl transferase family protein [Prosthecobacter sp.]
MKPRVCLISTVRHNVGDDFVREGIVWLLEKILGGVEARVVHKHFPLTVRGGFSEKLDAWTRGLPQRLVLSNLADSLPLNEKTDGILNSDIVVQCGAPVYWKNRYSSCAGTEWFGPLIERRWTRVRDRVPLLNLGAGSCQALASDGSEVWEDPACRKFIQDFTSAASLTTVRDCLAQQIVRQCGHEVPLLPCPSIFAPQAAGVPYDPRDYVALNYMPAAGHYDLAEQGETVRLAWERRFCESARALARRHPCLMVCHDHREYEEAGRLLPELPRSLTLDWRDCLKAYAGCQFALVNRVHGGVAAAAMGKPVLLIGNDSRLFSAKLVPGVRTLPVTAGREEYDQCVRDLEENLAAALPSFLRKAERDYLELLKPALSR